MSANSYPEIDAAIGAMLQRYAGGDSVQALRLLIRAAVLRLPPNRRAETIARLRLEFGADGLAR